MIICSVPAGWRAGVPGAGWQGGDSSAVLTVTLATPAPAGECSSQPSIGQQEVSICRIMYIIMLLLLSTGRSLQSGSRVLELVCTGWLCCPWSEFSDILHDGVQAWYNGTCAQSAQDTHATHRRASHTPNKGQGRQTH